MSRAFLDQNCSRYLFHLLQIPQSKLLPPSLISCLLSTISTTQSLTPAAFLQAFRTSLKDISKHKIYTILFAVSWKCPKTRTAARLTVSKFVAKNLAVPELRIRAVCATWLIPKKLSTIQLDDYHEQVMSWSGSVFYCKAEGLANRKTIRSTSQPKSTALFPWP